MPIELVPFSGTTGEFSMQLASPNTATPGTAGTPSSDVLTVQGAPDMIPVLVDASATTQPVSGTVAVSNIPAVQPVSGTVAVSTLDNTVLDSQQEQVSGPGNVYTTTGYQTISFQFAGSWNGSAQIFGSNDQINWIPLGVQNSTDGSNVDVIESNGIYTSTVSTKYVEYSFSLLTGTAAITVIGKVGTADDSMLLAQSFDVDSGVQLNTYIAGGLSKDSNGALILSDAPVVRQVQGAIGTNIVIDTQGYQSVHITTQAMAAGVTVSNDQMTWSVASGINVASLVSAPSQALVANSTYTFPVSGRYMRLTVTTAGTATVILRNVQQIQGTFINNNMQYVGGSAIVNAGVVGLQAIGGNIAPGAAPTSNPVPVGGVDPGNLTRRLLTDTGGRLATATTDQLGVVRAFGAMPPASTGENLAAVAVQDLSQFEGQSVIELLAQILVELKINNHYLFNLPALLTTGTINVVSDEPAAMRNEPSALS
jgi:hypothetical protein